MDIKKYLGNNQSKRNLSKSIHLFINILSQVFKLILNANATVKDKALF